jgi:hypothetical protein
MEHFFSFRYTMGHETPRDPATTGEATPTSDPVVENRETSVGSGACLKRLQELGLPVVRGLQKARTHRASPQTDPRPSAQVVQDPEATARPASFGGPPGFWPSYRPVDLEADRPVDREAVSHCLPPQPCLAVTSRHRVELPETGAPSPSTGRSGHRPLETSPLAAYKKTPSDVAPIWSSSMNPAFCSSPTWPAPGPQRGKRPSFAISTNKIESRRSAPWPCPPSGDGWPSISIFAPAISRGWMSEPSSNTCSGIFGGPWSCCGIGERSIAAGRSNTGSKTVEDFMWNSSRPTRLSSIPRNMSGTNPTAPWPTARPRTWSSLTECSETRCDEFVDRKNSFGPVSTLPICHGSDRASFLYLYEHQ